MRKTAAILLLLVLFLVCIGLMMLISVSTLRAGQEMNQPYYYVLRQFRWLALSLPAAFLVSRFDYHWWRHPVMLAGLSLLILAGLTAVFVPGIGMRIGGSARWVRLGPMRMQPSEFVKFFWVVILAAWMERLGWRVRDFRRGFFFPLAALTLVAGLVLLEPDYGAFAMLGMISFSIMLVAGVRWVYLGSAGVLGLSAFSLLVYLNPLRLGRVLAFIHPEKYPDVAYQLIQSKAALIRGGLFGVGPGNSIQKHYYLPEAHTDFILAIFGEEFGFLGVVVIVLSFMGILFCGAAIGARAPDRFGKLLAFGMTLLLSLQAIINVGVVSGCMPTTGLPLPFISYGGSSLLMSLLAVGVLVNVLRHVEDARSHVHTRRVRNAVQRL